MNLSYILLYSVVLLIDHGFVWTSITIYFWTCKLGADQQSEAGMLPIREQRLAWCRERDIEPWARARSEETLQQRREAS